MRGRSEFDGARQRNTIAPPLTPLGGKGHRPSASEKLRLTYLTGQHEDSTADPTDGVMEGMLPYDAAVEAMPQPELWRDVNG